MNDSEFKYLKELMAAIGVNISEHMHNKAINPDILIVGMTIRVKKSFLKYYLPLLYLAHIDHNKKRPIWMKKLRLLLIYSYELIHKLY